MGNTSDFFENKKSWSKFKDNILGNYLKPYLHKVKIFQKPIYIFDTFAGQGKFKNGDKGSPFIILNVINEIIGNYDKVHAVFIEKKYFKDLEKNITEEKMNNICSCINGCFEEKILELTKKINRDSNIFLYVDPYGIKNLDFNIFKELSKRNFNTIEMLLNFNSFGFLREGCRLLKYEKVNDEIEKEGKEEEEYQFIYETEFENNSKNCIENMNKIANGDYWQNILLKYNNQEINMKQAEEELTIKYIEEVKKNFKYVLNIPIKTKQKNIPKYRLIFATNHVDGLVLMAEEMNKNWNKMLEKERNGQLSLFEFISPDIYSNQKDYKKTIEEFLKDKKEFVNLKEILIKVYEEYGIKYSKNNYVEYLKELENRDKISIKRKPETTKTGRKSSFWEWKDGKEVRVKINE